MFESTRTNISMVKLAGSKSVLDTVMRPPRLVLKMGEASSTPAFSNFTEVLLLALTTGPPKPSKMTAPGVDAAYFGSTAPVPKVDPVPVSPLPLESVTEVALLPSVPVNW